MPSDPRDYKLELSSPCSADAMPSGRVAARPFLSVRFACCNVYTRIYRSADATRYEGRCPRCARPVRFRVGAGGTSDRFFVVE